MTYLLFGLAFVALGLLAALVAVASIASEFSDELERATGVVGLLFALGIIWVGLSFIRTAVTGPRQKPTKQTTCHIHEPQHLKVGSSINGAIAPEWMGGENPLSILEAERVPANHVAVGRVGVAELKLQEEGRVRARSRAQGELEALEIGRVGAPGAKLPRALADVVEGPIPTATGFDHNMGPEQLHRRTAQALEPDQRLAAFDAAVNEEAWKALSPGVANCQVVDGAERKERHKGGPNSREPLRNRVHAPRLRALAAGGWL